MSEEEIRKFIKDELLEIYIEKLQEENIGNRVFDLDGNVLKEDEMLVLTKVKKA